LLEQIRQRQPHAGVRSNVIVGFPGETEDDLAELERFLVAARLDAVGVFGYSDEDGTEAETLPEHLPQHEVDERVERLTSLVEELTAQRAEERVGERVSVLVEALTAHGAEGRAAHQAPEVDGATTLVGTGFTVGQLVEAVVTGTEGIDLIAEPVADPGRTGPA
jgi:tRNA A37 methylthiotransferase MiaB